MTDVKVLLQELQEESASGKPAAASITTRRKWPFVAVAAALAVAAVGAAVWIARDRTEQPARVTPLTTFAGIENYPSFSPDGNQVAFAWNGEKQDNWDLYVKMIGSATALRLTSDAAYDLYPAWSPDGRQIAFLRYGPHRGVFFVSPLGGPEQKIADFDAAPGAPAWSRDAKFLVAAKFYREQKNEAGAGALFLIPLQGGEPRPLLAPDPGRWYQYPAFAPDGRSLAFVSCEGLSAADSCDISLVELNGDMSPPGRPRQLAAVPLLIGLTWAADGGSLIYGACATFAAESCYLWRLDTARGAKPRRLEIAGQGASYPSLALKGNRLAFSRSVSDDDVWQLKVGEKPQPLLVSTTRDSNAQFSPDGRRIVFASGRGGGDAIALWLSNADGGGLVQLTSGPENRHGSPRWSPDGRWIAFDALSKEGRWNLKLVEANGGRPRQLTSGPFNTHVPNWSRDGRWIYFGSDSTGRSEIWRMPASGGSAEQITRDGGYTAVESPDGATLYYTKGVGDGALYARALGGGEEKQVLERVVARGFAVLEDGIYYLDQVRPRALEIRFHEFANGPSRLVSPIEGPLGFGLSVSPDRKTFLFTRFSVAGDLMLIDNFR